MLEGWSACKSYLNTGYIRGSAKQAWNLSAFSLLKAGEPVFTAYRLI